MKHLATKKINVVLEQQIKTIESDIQALNGVVVLEDDDCVMDELLANYNELDEKIQKQIQAYAVIADDEIAKKIEDAVYVDGKLKITLSLDKFKAFINVAPPEGKGKFVAVWDIEEELKKMKVLYGVNHERIRDLVQVHEENRIAIVNECVASGIVSEKGKNGEVQYLYDHTLAENDSKIPVAFPVAVQKDQLIAKLVPETKGKTGINVFGIEMQPDAADAAILQAGENVRMNKDTGDFFADIDGVIQKDKNILNVRNLLIVKENVDSTTGDIDFHGFVRIKGSVKNGFFVKAKEDIEVGGYIEGATVISQNGSVKVSGGIAGMGRGYVSAGKDVEAKYIENGKVFAKCAVKIKEAILNSSVAAGTDVEAVNGKGVIAGGKIRAGNSVKAKIFGAPSEVITRIDIGISLIVQEKIELIEQKSVLLRQTIAKINDTLEKVTGSSGKMDGLSEESKQKITELRKKVLILSYTEKKLAGEQSILEQQSLFSGKGTLFALETIHANIYLTMGNAKFNSRNEFGRTTLKFNTETQQITIQ